MIRALAIVVAVVAIAGCDNEPSSLRTYTIRLTRPDGTLHHTYTIHSEDEPSVVVYENEGGCPRVMSRRGFRCVWTQPFPVGWLVEVEPKAEAAGTLGDRF
jgi:hypothetical protein